MRYDAQNLIIHPEDGADPQLIVAVTPEQAGWDYIHFQVRHLTATRTWSFATGTHELALIVLAGRLQVQSNRGQWHLGQRSNVFAGLPHALYLPWHTTLSVRASTDSMFAVAWVPTTVEHAPHLIIPDEVQVEIRGGDQATRQVNTIIPPGFPCQRLVVVEAYTPGGNWSSFPPHKHDVHTTDAAGQLIEADLEEIYFYQFDHPAGYAYQRIYTDAQSPLHRAGMPIDTILVAQHNDLVLVPEGYHPVTSAPGSTTYYLNVLAGSAQSLANQDDPRYAWIKGQYRGRDPRLPIYEASAGDR